MTYLTLTQLFSALLISIHLPNLSHGQCTPSEDWYYDTDMNDTCVYEECTCETSGNNNTEISTCTKYYVNDQSSMPKFKEVCDDVANAGCDNIDDIKFVRCGTGGNTCTLYCGCNTTTDIDDLYYTDVDVYSQTCYSCECTTQTFNTGQGNELSIDGWECGNEEDSVNINDDDWDTWTCPQIEPEVLECYRRNNQGNRRTRTCSGNQTYCYYENVFEFETDELNWGYTMSNQNTTEDYNCVDGWFCRAFDANDIHKCATVDVTAYNVRECTNYTIDSYNINYLREIECCQSDFCNLNYSSDCVTDETLQTVEETIQECSNSLAAVNSVSGHYRYCPTSQFFDTDYHYCEFVAALATFELGCTYCEAYSTFYNLDRATIQIDYFNNQEVQNEIDGLIDDQNTCCEIEYNCNYNTNQDSKVSVELTRYYVSFDIRINDTDDSNFDQAELITELADEMGILEMETNITNVQFDQIIESTPDGIETISWAIVTVEVLIWCELAADQFVIDLEEGDYNFGDKISIELIPEQYNFETLTFTSNTDAFISDSGVKDADTVIGDDDGNSGKSKKNNNNDTLDGGAIAGIVIACLVVIIAIIATYWYFVIRVRNEENKQKTAQNDSEIRRSVVGVVSGRDDNKPQIRRQDSDDIDQLMNKPQTGNYGVNNNEGNSSSGPPPPHATGGTRPPPPPQ